MKTMFTLAMLALMPMVFTGQHPEMSHVDTMIPESFRNLDDAFKTEYRSSPLDRKKVEWATLKRQKVTDTLTVAKTSPVKLKATNDIYHFLDSTVRAKMLKNTYLYNDGMQPYELCTYTWDLINDQWQYQDIVQNTYDENGFKTVELHKKWDPTEELWSNSVRYNRACNENGGQTLYEIDIWVDDAWLTNYKWVNELSDNNKVLSRVYYRYNMDVQALEVTHKIEQAFDAEQRFIGYSYYEWNIAQSEWRKIQKYEWGYDAEGNETLYAYYYWDNSTQQLVGERKYQREFDDQNRTVVQAYYYWDLDINNWIGNYKWEGFYNNDSQLIGESSYGWNADLDDWQGDVKWEMAYDGQGNQIMNKEIVWDDDGASWVNKWLTESEYDSQNNRVLRQYSDWDKGVTDWVHTSKYTYEYNQNNAIVNINLYSWITAINDWQINQHQSREYNEYNSITYLLNRFWDTENEVWMPMYQASYVYNANNKIIQYLVQDWNRVIDDWENSEQILYTYDENHNLINRTNQSGDSQQWINNWKEVYGYNEVNQQIIREKYEWDNTSQSWYGEWKFEYFFFSDGSSSQIASYYWDAPLSTWISNNNSKWVQDVNDMGQTLLEEEYFWDDEENAWTGDYKLINGYDEFGNLIVFEQFTSWDFDNKAWIGYDKQEYTYDLSIPYSQLILPEPLSWRNKRTSSKHFGWNNGMWQEDGGETGYYYTIIDTTPTSIPEMHAKSGSVQIYPNPFADFLHIKLSAEGSATLELINLQGHTIINTIIVNEAKLLVGGMAPGLYLYIISMNGDVETGKILKK